MTETPSTPIESRDAEELIPRLLAVREDMDLVVGAYLDAWREETSGKPYTYVPGDPGTTSHLCDEQGSVVAEIAFIQANHFADPFLQVLWVRSVKDLEIMRTYGEES